MEGLEVSEISPTVLNLIVKKDFSDPRGGLGTVEGSEASKCLPTVLRRTRGFDISVGVKLDELAQLMIELGVANAINLDGSGSSSFIYLPPGQPAHAIVNHYHDAYEHDAHEKKAYFPSRTANEIEMDHLEEFLKPRVAGNHLGFR